MTSEISIMLGGHPEVDCNISLPVQVVDKNRVDEKYGWRNGYSDLDRMAGTDWGSKDE